MLDTQPLFSDSHLAELYSSTEVPLGPGQLDAALGMFLPVVLSIQENVTSMQRVWVVVVYSILIVRQKGDSMSIAMNVSSPK